MGFFHLPFGFPRDGVDKFIISILTNNVGITRVFYEIFRT